MRKHGTMLQIVKLGDGERKSVCETQTNKNHINCMFYVNRNRDDIEVSE
jgi:hypothetical protein